MRRGRWLIWLAAALIVSPMAFRALAAPWTWTFDQTLLTILTLGLLVSAGLWLRVWLQGGNALVKERWQARQRYQSPSKRSFGWSLVIWIVVALALVVLMNLYQY
jgi:hypothetical protein